MKEKIYYLYNLGSVEFRSTVIVTKRDTPQNFEIVKILWKEERSVLEEGMGIYIYDTLQYVFNDVDFGKVFERGMLEVL